MPAHTTSPIPSLSEKDKKRFWSNVDVCSEDECWEWTGGRTGAGYGAFDLKGKKYLAHRIAWFLENGPIPDGMLICHDCDNPPCKNVNHFFLGTSKDNTVDAAKKGRMATGKRNGKYTHPEKTPCGENNGSRTHPEKRPRGENHGMSNLTEILVLEIRKLYSEGEKQCVIGDSLEISKSQINKIVNRKTWTHI